MGAESVPETKWNVYRARYSQRVGTPDHEFIVLVKADSADSGRGTKLHVKGDVGLGMDYEYRPNYPYAADKSYKGRTLVGTLLDSKVASFEQIAQSIKPPHDPEVMFGKKPPFEDCSTWINSLLHQARNLIRD